MATSSRNTFEIEVAPENGGGPQVTLGQRVGERLFVRVQQGIGDQSTTNVVLEYELAPWLRPRPGLLLQLLVPLAAAALRRASPRTSEPVNL